MPHLTEPLRTSCKRNLPDRRQANLRSLVYALFMSRRRTRRRQLEAGAGYFDQYDTVTFVLALVLMLLSIADAYLTLLLIQHGSAELNPLLAWALKRHVMLFFLAKYLLTGVSVVVTVMHRHFRFFGLRGIHILLAGVVAYTVLIEYQLSMLLPFWFS